MKSARMWGLIVIVVALAAITLLSAAGKRDIEMAITLPNGAEPHVTVIEGNTATLEFDGRKVGFVPTFRPGDDSTVNVAVFDMKANPHRQLGQVDVPVSGDRVPSQTTPGFEIRIASVGEWK